MGIGDKLNNAAEKAAGKAKEATGKTTDDRDLQAEGQADQKVASTKQAGENVKDVFRG
ncbi:CsbD family protein [Kineococcus sp. SYSU DK004]|uniref:CsbD family protein n=1 Tax=Kineococcus sp. SYSU DK004 TaxID=3383125 RepID=UPI003D7D69ED